MLACFAHLFCVRDVVNIFPEENSYKNMEFQKIGAKHVCCVVFAHIVQYFKIAMRLIGDGERMKIALGIMGTTLVMAEIVIDLGITVVGIRIMEEGQMDTFLHSISIPHEKILFTLQNRICNSWFLIKKKKNTSLIQLPKTEKKRRKEKSEKLMCIKLWVNRRTKKKNSNETKTKKKKKKEAEKQRKRKTKKWTINKSLFFLFPSIFFNYEEEVWEILILTLNVV